MNKWEKRFFLIGIVIVCSFVWQSNTMGANFYELNDKDHTTIDLDKVVFIWKDNVMPEIYFGLFEGAIISLWKLEYRHHSGRDSDYERLLEILNAKQLQLVTNSKK